MNKVILCGRLTKDPEVRYTSDSQPMCISRFSLAVDRKKKGDKQETDFISCVTFGKLAEVQEKYFKKGTKVIVTGKIQTGSYTRQDGVKVYTTDVVIDEQEFAESKHDGSSTNASTEAPADNSFMNIPDGIDEDLPFN